MQTRWVYLRYIGTNSCNQPLSLILLVAGRTVDEGILNKY